MKPIVGRQRWKKAGEKVKAVNAVKAGTYQTKGVDVYGEMSVAPGGSRSPESTVAPGKTIGLGAPVPGATVGLGTIAPN